MKILKYLQSEKLENIPNKNNLSQSEMLLVLLDNQFNNTKLSEEMKKSFVKIFEKEPALINEIISIFNIKRDVSTIMIFKDNDKFIKQLHNNQNLINMKDNELFFEKIMKYFTINKNLFDESKYDQGKRLKETINDSNTLKNIEFNLAKMILLNKEPCDKLLFEKRVKIIKSFLYKKDDVINNYDPFLNSIILDVYNKIKLRTDSFVWLTGDENLNNHLNGNNIENLPTDLVNKIKKQTNQEYNKGKVLIFIVDEENNISVAQRFYKKNKLQPNIHHTDLSKGKAVKTAGEIIINEDGKIITITNFSGHYQPELESLKCIKDYLIDKNMDINNICFIDFKFEEKLFSEKSQKNINKFV